MKIKRQKSKVKSGGFTIAEILVATTLFSLVVGVITGIFLASYRSQRSAFSFLNAHNNIRFSLEAMAREMRTSTDFQSPGCPALSLCFTNQEGESVAYRLSGGRLERGVAGSFFPLTASEVVVENFKFTIDGQASGDGKQPRVTLSLKISAQLGNQRYESVLQTTITQRELDS